MHLEKIYDFNLILKLKNLKILHYSCIIFYKIIIIVQLFIKNY